MSMEENLRKYIDELIQEVEQELDEATTTAGVDGYQTPFAFGGGRDKDKKKQKKNIDVTGYTKVKDIDESVNEGIIQDREKELKRLRNGAKVSGGGYGPFVKIGSNSFKNPKTNTLYHSAALASLIGTFNDFKINESYKGTTTDFKTDISLALDSVGISPKAIKKISKKGKGFELRMSSYMKDKNTWEKLGKEMGAKLVDFQPGSINIGLYESVLSESKLKPKKLTQLKKGEKFVFNNKPYEFVELYTGIDDAAKVKKEDGKTSVVSFGGGVVNKNTKGGFGDYLKQGGRVWDNVNPTNSPSLNEKADYKYLTQVILDAKPKYDVYYNSSHNVVNIGGVGYDKGDLVKNFNQKPGSSSKIKNNFYHAHQDPQKTKREVEKLSKGKIKVKVGDRGFLSYSVNESVNEAKVKRPVNRWLELKNDDTMTANKKMATGLKELKYQLAETEKFFNWYNKIKNINELDSDKYWKRTNKHIYKIKERLVNIARTIKEIEK